MIVTLTLNPSLDRTVEVPALARGSVTRVSSARLDPGGKGVNVARALLANGVDARAVLPVGGPVGHQLVELLEAEGVAMTAVPVAGATRSNLTLSEPDGTVTKINEAGEPLTAAEIEQLADAVTGLAGPGDWAVLSGSVPAGRRRRRLRPPHPAVHRGRHRGGGRHVGAGAPARHRGRPGAGQAQPRRGGRGPRPRGRQRRRRRRRRPAGAQGRRPHGPGQPRARWRGARRGTAACGGARAPSPARRSTVGAGDCLLAGFLAGGGADREALATALRWAAAAVERPGSGVPDPADIARRPAYVTDQLDDTGRSRCPADRSKGRRGQGGPGGPPTTKKEHTMETTFTPPVEGTGVKATIQRVGGYLAGMVMPNIGAFIAWGLITALFIPDGWLPNEKYAALVEPMIFYLLPILIGYTGGKLVHGQRGAVIGAVATMGVIVGADDPDVPRRHDRRPAGRVRAQAVRRPVPPPGAHRVRDADRQLLARDHRGRHGRAGRVGDRARDRQRHRVARRRRRVPSSTTT